MRRLLAITIIALLGTTLAAPLFASASSNLPQCCRRDGVHHCASSMAGSNERAASAVVPKCPAFPKAIAAPAASGFLVNARQDEVTPLFVHPASAPQTEARYRISFARSRQKRGPPSAATIS